MPGFDSRIRLMRRWVLERTGWRDRRRMVGHWAFAAIGARPLGAPVAGYNRRYFEGMLWIARSGSQWRLLPDEYGKWNSVFRRYRRWVITGVFDALLESLADLARPDREAHMIDSTVIRAHHCAVGIKRGIRIGRHSGARAAASRPKSMPDATAGAGRSASS